MVINELEKAAKYITDNNYHPNHMGIQFVQIGNDSGADMALRALTQAQVNVCLSILPNSRLQVLLCHTFAQFFFYHRAWLTQCLTRVLLHQRF